MRVHQAYRFALNPSPRQERMLASHAGAARFAWNWDLGACRDRYAAEGKWYSAIDLSRCGGRPPGNVAAQREKIVAIHPRLRPVNVRVYPLDVLGRERLGSVRPARVHVVDLGSSVSQFAARVWAPSALLLEGGNQDSRVHDGLPPEGSLAATGEVVEQAAIGGELTDVTGTCGTSLTSALTVTPDLAVTAHPVRVLPLPVCTIGVPACTTPAVVVTLAAALSARLHAFILPELRSGAERRNACGAAVRPGRPGRAAVNQEPGTACADKPGTDGT